MPTVLALGLDPSAVDLADSSDLTPDLIKAFIEAQLQRVREAGYQVNTCLVDTSGFADAVTAKCLSEKKFDCVMIGAGLRAPQHLLLFEKLLNLVHVHAPAAKICFNTTPADSLDAVQRWV